MSSPARPFLMFAAHRSPHGRPSGFRTRLPKPWAAAAGLVAGLTLAQPGLAAESSYSPDGPDAGVEATASSTAGQIATWVRDTADNQGLPFLIVDKINARVLVFDREGQPLGEAPVLLGLAPGDVSPPGIGDRPLSRIGPEDRVTPAGRFLASMGENLGGKTILWIDYDTALSLHPVITTRPADRRLQRLATATALDNRISYGCINVPAKFYEDVVQPLFEATVGVVYILPETRTIPADYFASASTVVTSPSD